MSYTCFSELDCLNKILSVVNGTSHSTIITETSTVAYFLVILVFLLLIAFCSTIILIIIYRRKLFRVTCPNTLLE